MLLRPYGKSSSGNENRPELTSIGSPFLVQIMESGFGEEIVIHCKRAVSCSDAYCTSSLKIFGGPVSKHKEVAL